MFLSSKQVEENSRLKAELQRSALELAKYVSNCLVKGKERISDFCAVFIRYLYFAISEDPFP